MIIFYAILNLLSGNSFAGNLPAAIESAQKLLVSQGECEASWNEIAPPTSYDLGHGYKVWFIGCAQWSYNIDNTVFITIEEKSQPEGFLTKELYFINYSPYRKLFAENAIHNFQFDPITKNLTSEYFYQGSGICGTRARYSWNETNQDFGVQEIWKQEDCRNPSAPWEKIYPLK